MMPALIRAIVVRWEVKVVGNTPVVSFKENHPTSFVTDGGPVGSARVIRQYILHFLPANERPELAQAWLNGLLRAYDVLPTVC